MTTSGILLTKLNTICYEVEHSTQHSEIIFSHAYHYTNVFGINQLKVKVKF